MLKSNDFQDLAKRLSHTLPPGLSGVAEDIEKNFHAVLQAAFEKMQLVGREEFEVQRAVLARTRQKLEQLEARVTELEARLNRP